MTLHCFLSVAAHCTAGDRLPRIVKSRVLFSERGDSLNDGDVNASGEAGGPERGIGQGPQPVSGRAIILVVPQRTGERSRHGGRGSVSRKGGTLVGGCFVPVWQSCVLVKLRDIKPR